MELTTVLRGLVGVTLILGIAFLFSNNKRKISWKLVGVGLSIQLIFAVFIIHGETFRSWFFILGWPKDMLNWFGGMVVKILSFITEGSLFVFGSLAVSPGNEGSLGFFFAFQVLPTI
ncbi:MAG: NupC/NupG family nucleoside CNT transporter, partial [Candidatus Aminicenantes bacterium]|nr:NupC/NupG family nucleoside CNT transporter [Candidatus Aminicenantes bacterium]